jgi:hypothetical protein
MTTGSNRRAREGAEAVGGDPGGAERRGRELAGRPSRLGRTPSLGRVRSDDAGLEQPRPRREDIQVRMFVVRSCGWWCCWRETGYEGRLRIWPDEAHHLLCAPVASSGLAVNRRHLSIDHLRPTICRVGSTSSFRAVSSRANLRVGLDERTTRDRARRVWSGIPLLLIDSRLPA